MIMFKIFKKEKHNKFYEEYKKIGTYPELIGKEKVDNIIVDLFQSDSYLAGAISSLRKDLIKKEIIYMEELLIKSNKLNHPRRKDITNYLQKAIKIANSCLKVLKKRKTLF